MMVIKESAEAISATAKALQSTPLAFALLIINIGFLAFAAYVLGEVSSNAQERNKNQMELINKLAVQCQPVK